METLVAEIIGEVADTEGVDPEDLDYQIQHFIPLDAVEELSNHETASWTLTFELPSHDVTITDDGTVVVSESEEELGQLCR